MSEIKRIRERIEAEYEAAYTGLHGFAIFGKHDFISRRMEEVDKLHQQLIPLVGREEAIRTIIEIADRQGERA